MSDAIDVRGETMYLVLPVPFRILDGKLCVEAQAANGLDQWADNFDRITVAAPLIPEALVPALAGFVWRSVDSLTYRERIVCEPLPWAYSPMSFFRHVGAVREQIVRSIRHAKHLQFAIGGLVGDWAAVAALEAIRLRRRYAVHTDRVEHELIRRTSSGAGGIRRLRVAIEAPLMERYHRYIIERCSLGLWHGNDCYRTYSPWCAESHLIHDVHTKPEDLVSDEVLAHKVEDARSAETLRLYYTGRLDPMKAPLEWLQGIAAAREAGVKLKATWLGDGPLLEEVLAERTRLKLEDVVDYPGFVSGRAELLAQVRSAHAVVFTHITPESPRNLLEALVSGTPIVGYDNAYAVNLLEGLGGGALVGMHDTAALGRLIWELAGDRERLAELTEQAARNGRRFSDAAVFEERSQLIRRYA